MIKSHAASVYTYGLRSLKKVLSEGEPNFQFQSSIFNLFAKTSPNFS